MEAGRDRFVEFMATRRFASLEGLRALAISAVIWHHTVGEAGPVIGRSPGVTLFFVLSGFLITTMLIREKADTGSVAVRAFYLRRLLRIFPLYYAVIIVYVILVETMEARTPAGREFVHNLPYYLSFTSDWFVDYRAGHRVIFYFAWSMAVQEQFYAVWPWVVRSARSWRFPVFVAGALLVIGDTARWAVSAGLLPEGVHSIRLLTAIAAPIFVGCVAAGLAHVPRGFAVLEGIAGRIWSVPLALGLVALPLRYQGAPHLLATAALTLLVLACVVRSDGLLGRLLEHRALQYVGKISFGIYLTHMLAMNLIRRLIPGLEAWGCFALTLPVSIGVASLSYRYIERPFLQLKDAFAPAAVTAESRGPPIAICHSPGTLP